MSAHANIVATLSVSLLAAGCLAAEGASCRLDSDCDPGLICGFDGTCQTFAAVQASLRRDTFVEVITLDTSSGPDADATGCRPVQGVFESGAAPCPAPADKRTVTGLFITEQGHGLARLAPVANPVIADGYAKGTLVMELWIDGDLDGACPRVLAWVRDPGDIGADCVPAYSNALPFEIPNLVSTVIESATFDPATNLLTGLVNKPALIASMDPALRDVADQLITEDVDTDGDTVPDRASAILEVLFP